MRRRAAKAAISIVLAALCALSMSVLALPAETGPTFEELWARAAGPMNVFFGNLHSHTGYSDGTGTPDAAYSWARESAKLDFYAITDHSEEVTPAEWQDTLNQADAHNVNGKFIALAGFEWTSGAGHACVYNTRARTDTYATPSLESLYNWIAANGATGQFNHPARSAGTFGDFAPTGNPNASRMRLIETGNAGAGNNTGFFFPYYIMALDKGWKVSPTSNQDNHSLKTNSHRTGVIAKSLTRPNLADALANGRVYSSDDPNLALIFKCGDAWMGSSIERRMGKYTFDVLVKDDEDIAKVELLTNGGAVVAQQAYDASTHVKKVVWNPEVDFQSPKAYYFVRVTERDTNDEDESHRGNQVALSAPIRMAIPQHDVSIKVESDREIVAERPMYFSYHGAWAGGTTEIGVNTPRNTWFLSEGTTRRGFEEWVCIQNPGETSAYVRLMYMFARGGTQRKAVIVPAHSRVTVDVNTAVGPEKDVSVRVDSDQPVVVERPMYFNYQGMAGGSIASAVPEPATRWYLAEGTTRPGFKEWLSLMNPCTKTSRVGITYMFPGGETRHQSIAVAANSRATVDVNDAVGPGKDVSIVVDSDLPLIAERPMYFNYQGQMAGGSTQFGATSPGTDWLFAEGTTRNNNADGRYDEYLCIQNPGGTPAGVTLTYMFTDGTTKQTRKMVVPNSRQTVSVNAEVGPDKDVSVRVTSDAPVVVERPMYYNYHGALPGGDVELGCKATARTWYFAEGTNRDGFEEWLTLLNPGAEPAEVNLTMMLEDGTTRQYSCTVAPTSRKTITVNGLLAL